MGKTMLPRIPGEMGERRRVVGDVRLFRDGSVAVGIEVSDGEGWGVRIGIGRAFWGCGARIAGEDVMVRG